MYDDDGNDVTINGWALDLELVATPYPSQLVVAGHRPVRWSSTSTSACT